MSDPLACRRGESGSWLNGFHIEESRSSENGCPRILIRDVDVLSPYGFDLKGTFESGQCFRWYESGKGRYAGIVRGKAVAVSLCEKKHLLIENATPTDFLEIWHDYFDLSTNYAPILEKVDKDAFLHHAALFSGGARLLRQDFGETLFSYILSSQNNIPRIRNLVEDLCRKYGNRIPAPEATSEFSGYSFPSVEVLSQSFCPKARPGCRSGSLCETPFGGYRCPYLRNTAEKIASGQIVPDFAALASSDAKEARGMLCRFPGVGEKVADCVLLYSGIRPDICPVDTWVERTIRSVYLDSRASKKEIRSFTESYFGEFAGYTQLWFFNYVRSHPESCQSGSDG